MPAASTEQGNFRGQWTKAVNFVAGQEVTPEFLAVIECPSEGRGPDAMCYVLEGE